VTKSRQYLACSFRPGATTRYTYHNDRDPVAVGDRVVVSGRAGPATVIVAEILDAAPAFETKPIVGLERPIEDIDAAEAA
jgi:hypothetical protein